MPITSNGKAAILLTVLLLHNSDSLDTWGTAGGSLEYRHEKSLARLDRIVHEANDDRLTQSLIFDARCHVELFSIGRELIAASRRASASLCCYYELVLLPLRDGGTFFRVIGLL